MALSFGIKQNVGAVTVVFLSCNWEETHGKHTWLRTEERQMHGRDIWWWLSAVITRLERLKGYWSSHYPQIRQPGSHSTQIFHPSIINNTFLWVNFSLFLKVMSQILNHRQRRKGRNASGTVAEVISQRGIFISPQHQWIFCDLLSLPASPLSFRAVFQQRQTKRTWIVNSQMFSMVLWQRKENKRQVRLEIVLKQRLFWAANTKHFSLFILVQ